MWEYRLALTDYQRILLGLHVWEMLGKKYQYFFFDRNCGFRLAELFDLVIEEELLGGAGWWYAPVDLFHQIDSINENRIRAGKPGIIASVAFVPSARRKLFYELSGLHHSEIRYSTRWWRRNMPLSIVSSRGWLPIGKSPCSTRCSPSKIIRIWRLVPI